MPAVSHPSSADRPLSVAALRPTPRRSRLVLAVLGLCSVVWTGCATVQPVKEPPPSTEIELAYDAGPTSERPLLPPNRFEWLIKFDPGLPAYQPHRLRLLVAQPGAVRIAIYAADASGRPGQALRTLDRMYAPEQTSNGQDGKWLLEPLYDLPRQTGPLFVGLSVPTPGPNAARLWATAVDPAAPARVFARDAEPTTALQSTRLPSVPMLRLALITAEPPPKPAAPPTPASPAASPAASTDPATPAPPAAASAPPAPPAAAPAP